MSPRRGAPSSGENQGHQDPFEEVYEADWNETVRRLIRRDQLSPADAEDTAQEIYFALYCRRSEIRNIRVYHRYVYKWKLRSCRTENRRLQHVSLDEVPTSGTSAATDELRVTDRAALRELAKLGRSLYTRDEWALLMCRNLYGLRQSADRLGLTYDQVKKRSQELSAKQARLRLEFLRQFER